MSIDSWPDRGGLGRRSQPLDSNLWNLWRTWRQFIDNVCSSGISSHAHHYRISIGLRANRSPRDKKFGLIWPQRESVAQFPRCTPDIVLTQ